MTQYNQDFVRKVYSLITSHIINLDKLINHFKNQPYRKQKPTNHMGSINCCEEKEPSKEKKRICTSLKSIDEKNMSHILPLSTLESPQKTQNQNPELQKSPLMSISFTGYLKQKDVELSEIKLQESGQDDWCSEQKLFLSYLERLSKQIQTYRKQNDPKLQQVLADRNHKVTQSEKKFIQHASKCPVCNQLFQNLKNVDVEIQQTQKAENPDFKRKSLRDSLLEFVQEDKVISTQDSTYLNSHSYEEAKKAMKKYSNINAYQCKRLRFRKTSGFQPQIQEVNESQEVTICR